MAKTKKESMLEKASELVEQVEEKIEEVVGEKKPVKRTEESTEDKKAKLKALIEEKARKLKEKVSEAKDIDIKGEVKGDKDDKKDTLVPMDDYLKSSIHLGTRVITPHMRQYVYRRRADGLAVFNTAMLDDKIREGAEYLAKFAPEDLIVVCKREAGWKAVQKFAETLGIKSFTKKYPAGVLTNTQLKDFFEIKMVFICDPWLDKNALVDANKVGAEVLGLCDTNNFTWGINKVIPGNNKSAKSLGMVFYLLAKLYAEKRKMKITLPNIQDFVEGWDDLQEPANNGQ